MTPRFFCSGESKASALRAPRSLKLPVRWRYSSLQKIFMPVASDNGIESGHGDCTTWPATRPAASWMFRKLTDMSLLVIGRHPMSTAEVAPSKNAKLSPITVWGTCCFRSMLMLIIKLAGHEKRRRLTHQRPVPGGTGAVHLLRGKTLPGSLPRPLLAGGFHHGGAGRSQIRLSAFGRDDPGREPARLGLRRRVPRLLLHEGVLAADL